MAEKGRHCQLYFQIVKLQILEIFFRFSKR